MRPAEQLATYADLAALPEHEKAEVLCGEVSVSPAPLPRHSRVQRTIGRFIGGPFDDDDGQGGPGGWWILIEVDVELSPHDVVRPDLAGWRRARLDKPWDERPLRVVPDWVCEILSPSSAAQDRVRKRQLYAQHLVPYYWIVDPAERTVEALHLEEGRWTDVGTHDATACARVPPFDAIELDLRRIFPPE